MSASLSPQEQIQRVRDLYAAFGRGDIAAVRGALAGDVIWHEAGRHEHTGTYHGIDQALNAVLGSVPQTWQSFSLDLHDVLSNGDHTVALVDWNGTSKHDGKSYNGHSVLVAHVDDAGKLAEIWVIWEDPSQLERASGHA